MSNPTQRLPGVVLPYEPQPCGACGGSGRQEVSETSNGAYREYSIPCSACNGHGSI